MGGQEGSRGYLYQAIAAVIESLSDKSWDKIYIEYPSEKDKVDIALEVKGVIAKVIQVKSTNSSFQKNDVVRWLNDLIDDNANANCVQMYLIGSCTSGVPDFFESIKKYKSDKMDIKAKKSLSSFDCRRIDIIEVKHTILPFKMDILKGVLRDSLNRYFSKKIEFICFDKLDFIVDAIVNEQMFSSTTGEGIDRVEFEENLNNRLLLLSNKYQSDRVSVGIQSFGRGAETLSEDVDEYYDLQKYFDGRYLQDEYSWNENVYLDLERFLTNKLDKREKYQIYLETHSSIAFSAGRILDSKSGMDVLPFQKLTNHGVVLWDIDDSEVIDYDWNVEYISVKEDAFETVLVLNVTKIILDDVVKYLTEKNFSIGTIINCTPKDRQASSISIKNGTHAFQLADSVYRALTRRTTEERRSILHIFSAAPNGFMFFLGKRSGGFGKCILYEYDFEQKRSCTYNPSISFIN